VGAHKQRVCLEMEKTPESSWKMLIGDGGRCLWGLWNWGSFATSRLIIHSKIKDEFAIACWAGRNYAGCWRRGPGPSRTASQRRPAAASQPLSDAHSEGAKGLLGGAAAGTDCSTVTFQPTVLDRATMPGLPVRNLWPVVALIQVGSFEGDSDH